MKTLILFAAFFTVTACKKDTPQAPTGQNGNTTGQDSTLTYQPPTWLQGNWHNMYVENEGYKITADNLQQINTLTGDTYTDYKIQFKLLGQTYPGNSYRLHMEVKSNGNIYTYVFMKTSDSSFVIDNGNEEYSYYHRD